MQFETLPIDHSSTDRNERVKAPTQTARKQHLIDFRTNKRQPFKHLAGPSFPTAPLASDSPASAAEENQQQLRRLKPANVAATCRARGSSSAGAADTARDVAAAAPASERSAARACAARAHWRRGRVRGAARGGPDGGAADAAAGGAEQAEKAVAEQVQMRLAEVAAKAKRQRRKPGKTGWGMQIEPR